jgi:tetratricopeptide (TPR) repeat protein
MKHISLLVIASAFCIGSVSLAQQAANPAPDNPSAESPDRPALTPRQIAEMRGDILMARKQYELAITAYQDILKKEPKNAVLLNKIGIAYEDLGDTDRAEYCYRKSIAANKHFPIPVNNFGTLEYARQHYGRAIKLYLKAASLKMDVAPIYSNLAYAYYANKEYPKAMDAFAKALAADPQIFDRKEGSGGSVLQQRTAPDPATLFFLMAKSYAKIGDAERAAHYLKLARDDGYKNYKSVEKDPEFARVIKDPRVQDVLKVTPSYIAEPDKPVSE